MGPRDLMCGPLTTSEAIRLSARGVRVTLWRRDLDEGNSKPLTDLRIVHADDDVAVLEHADGRREVVDRASLFVPARIVRRLDLDGSVARVLDVLSSLPPW